MSSVNLRGVFPPIPTPFTADGEVAHDQLAANIARWNRTALAGYVVLGSNGEYVYLSEKEKLEVLETARAAIPADKLMIAGTGCEATRAAIDLTQAAAKIGADAALVLHPYYYKSQMSTPVLVNHYRQLADASPIPILIYNMPANSGLDLPAELVARLAEHPNIIGIKDSSGNLIKMGEMIRTVPSRFAVLAGSASFFWPALSLGAQGGILALANIAPEACIEIYRSFMEGDLERGRDLQLRMLPLNAAITSRFGPGGLKVALDMVGYYGGPPRLPLLPPDEAQRKEIEAILKQAGLL